MVNTKKLKKLMEQKGMNQEALADAVGVTQAAMSYILRGLKDPSLKTIVNISKVLGCTIDEITVK
jgi:transcriptional regulator with XRE-family HTH domain